MSYFTLRTIIFLMETMKDFYSSRTVPPSAAVATRRCDLRVNEYAGLYTRCHPMSEQGVQKIIMGYSNHFVMAITSAEVKV